MSPTAAPLTLELEALSASLESRARQDRPLGAAELQATANRLAALSGQVARIERFHADVLDDLAEDEMLHLPTRAASVQAFLDDFYRTWGGR